MDFFGRIKELEVLKSMYLEKRLTGAIIYTFYECKYTNSILDKSIYLEEVNQLNDAKITNYRLGFFSKSGFSNDNEFKNCNLF